MELVVVVMAQRTCQRCGYEWEYTGSMRRATCPSCSYKVAAEDPPTAEVDADR